MPAPSDLRVGTPAEMVDAVTRSHLADGRCVGWYGGRGVVIDAELADRPVPSALARRYGTHDFWRRWTRAECAAKAADVPIARWLGRHGLDAGGTDVSTVALGSVVVAVLAGDPSVARGAGDPLGCGG